MYKTNLNDTHGKSKRENWIIEIIDMWDGFPQLHVFKDIYSVLQELQITEVRSLWLATWRTMAWASMWSCLSPLPAPPRCPSRWTLPSVPVPGSPPPSPWPQDRSSSSLSVPASGNPTYPMVKITGICWLFPKQSTVLKWRFPLLLLQKKNELYIYFQATPKLNKSF